MLNAEKVAEQYPEFSSKNKASISDSWVQKTMMMHYYVYYNLYKPRCINANLD